MSNQESKTIPSNSGDQSNTVQHPVVPVNQPSTRDASNPRKLDTAPVAPMNEAITCARSYSSLKTQSGGGNGGSGKPTPPPNTDTTKGGGK
jgi:hypothetical protein